MAKKTSAAVEKPRRLTPKPDVLRQLYLLSGNNCAMTGCRNVIVDRRGLVIGQICHIEAAMPDGARFNKSQTNEERRALSNLVLICAIHHLKIDSKLYEKEWTVEKVRKLKADHEAKFKAIEGSLEQSFKSRFVDSTESLDPTDPGDFKKLERLVPECVLSPARVPQRKKEVEAYIQKLKLVPEEERAFILSVINRFIRLDAGDENVSVDVYDLMGAFKLDDLEIKQKSAALERYGVGDLDEVTVDWRETHHIRIYDPSKHLTWLEIAEFCDKSGNSLDDFVLHLKFGLLEE